MQHMRAEFGFETGIVLSGNSSVTLPYTRDKGNQFGTKISINTYKCIRMRDNEIAITYNRGFRGRRVQRRHF